MKKLIAVLLVLLVAGAMVFARDCSTCGTSYSGSSCPNCNYARSYQDGHNQGMRDGMNQTVDANYCAPKTRQGSYSEEGCLDGYLDGVKKGQSIYE